MAASSFRKAIGAVKDQTSISIAKVAGNVAPDLEILIVKATTHDNEPVDDKYVREILNLVSNSKGYVNACVFAISKRLSKTHDWIVALKALMLVHRLLNDGDPVFAQEIMYTSKKGVRVLNMSDFRDKAHSSSWDHSGFVRTYSLYLDQKLEFLVYERKLSVGDDDKKKMLGDGYGEFRDEPSYGMGKRSSLEMTPIREMGPERTLERLNQLLRLLDRFLACKPTGAAKNTRMVLVALYLLVKESFGVYSDTSNMLNILLDRFSELDYAYCVKAFDVYVNASKTIDELVRFYTWCMDIGVLRSSEFPEVQKISDKLLGKLEGVLREKGNKPKSPKKSKEDVSSSITNINEIKSLPAPENYKPPTFPQPLHKPPNQKITEELMNLKDDNRVSADEHDNKLALALFSGNTSTTWQKFEEDGKGDWELALVETTSNLSSQKSDFDLGGGFDSLLLTSMYDSGTIRQHVNNSRLSGGSSSSVAMPGMSKSKISVLALPGPDGTVQRVGQEDPFAASLLVPPPSYVQIADMERKQQLLTQEQQLWQQYARNGMQGQMNLGQTSGYYYAS
ncbi:hypothetical protein RD792_018026 [Penstemon davidsonii]|uniref:ENTH domain-containing protein n=1 Tax=Penstemon davidsonii TaxID=160366 RepID=A0ABR0DWI0_9LAMI|nr:hypothetical protein RD792_018026 [Penstemon davidsonii]